MNRFRIISVLCVLCLALSGCGPRQEAAGSAEEAVLHFLADLQSGAFEEAKTYLAEGNPLLCVFPAGEAGEDPALDGVYRQFCEKMQGITFRVGDRGAAGNSMVYITAAQYDFRSSVNDAMLDALQDQCRNGGDAFADYAGWMSRGIAGAQMGGEDTIRVTASRKQGRYEIGHQSYMDHAFMDLISGGFFDYTGLQMAVCTGTLDGVEHTYYFAALGDDVIACIQEITEVDRDGEMTEEVVAGLNEFYTQAASETPGICMGVHKDGDRYTVSVGIDFQTADQDTLVSAGMVDGTYQGSKADGRLSLSATVSGLEQDGMRAGPAVSFASGCGS